MSATPHTFCPLYVEEITSPLEKLTLRIDRLPAAKEQSNSILIQGTLTWEHTTLTTTIRLKKSYDKIHLIAHCTGQLPATCSRTLQPFMWDLNITEQERLCPSEDAELFESGTLNIAEWTRQQIELNRPMSPLHPAVAKGDVATFIAQEEYDEEASPFYELKALAAA